MADTDGESGAWYGAVACGSGTRAVYIRHRHRVRAPPAPPLVSKRRASWRYLD
jgi:hypothetical protein